MNDLMVLLIEYFRQYSFWFLAAVIIIQAIGLPTGANVFVMAAGAFAYSGEFSLAGAWLEIWIFSLLGDVLSYFFWKSLGQRIFLRYPSIHNYLSPGLEKTASRMDRYGKSVILLTRFPLSAFGPVVNILAGTTSYRLPTFTILVAVGEIGWGSAYFGLGYWFGDSWENIANLLNQFGQLTILLTAIVVAGYLLKKTVCKDNCFQLPFSKQS